MKRYGEKQCGAGWLFWGLFLFSIVPATIFIAKSEDFTFQDPWYYLPLIVIVASLPAVLLGLIGQTLFSAVVVVLNREFKLKEWMFFISILAACVITFLLESWLPEESNWKYLSRAFPGVIFIMATRFYTKRTNEIITSQLR